MDLCHRRWWLVNLSLIALLGSGACFRRRVRCGGRCGRDGPRSRRRRWDQRTLENAPILDRVVSQITITDPHHFLFGHRVAVLGERSGRGPSYVVVELSDGRKRSVPLAATDLGQSASALNPTGPGLARISVRTLIPLAQYLNRILTLLPEEVIRDESASTCALPQCVSHPDRGGQNQPASGLAGESVAGAVAGDTGAASSDAGKPIAADAAGGCSGRNGDCPC